MVVSAEDRDNLIRTVIGEVDPNDPDAGRAAVAHVVLNRLSTGRYGKTATDVVHQRGAFEPWARRARELLAIDPSSKDYQRTANIVDSVISGDTPDPTNGATHFYSPRDQAALGRKPPSWAQGDGTAIGGHTFYAPDGPARAPAAAAIDQAIGAAPAIPAAAIPFTDDHRSDVLGRYGLAPATSAAVSAAPAAPARTGGDAAADFMSRYGIAEATPPGEVTPEGRTADLREMGTGLVKGARDVINTGGQGINFLSDKVAQGLAAVGVVPPGVAAETGLRRSKLNAAIEAENKQFEIDKRSGLSDIGRIGGQLAVTAPLMGPLGEAAAVPVNMLTRASPMVARTIAEAGTNLPGRIGLGAASGAPLGAGVAALTSAASDKPLVDQMIEGATAGGAFGAAAPAVVSGARAAGRKIFRSGIDADTADLADIAIKKWGIPLRPPALTGPGSFVSKLDQMTGQMPLSGRRDQMGVVRDAWMKGVSNTIGEDTTAITRGTLKQAYKRIGGVMDGVESRTTIPIDTPLLQDLATVAKNVESIYTRDSPQYKAVYNHITNVVKRGAPYGDTLPGPVYKSLVQHNSELDNLIGSGEPIARFGTQIKSALQDALSRSATPADAAAYRAARLQYKNAKTIEPLVIKGVPGEISPLNLQNRVAQNFGIHEPGDLGELADIGQKFFREPKDSGTPIGSKILHALSSPGAIVGEAGMAMAGGHFAGADPVTLALMGAAGGGGLALSAAGSRSVGGVLGSKAYMNYLMRTAGRVTPPSKLYELASGAANIGGPAGGALATRTQNPPP